MNNPPERDTLEAAIGRLTRYVAAEGRAENYPLRVAYPNGQASDAIRRLAADLRALLSSYATLQANLSQVTGEREEKRARRGYPVAEVDQIDTLRAQLSSVTMYLDDILTAGKFPGKGRSIDEKASIDEWWAERHGAVESARAALAGVSVEEFQALQAKDPNP